MLGPAPLSFDVVDSGDHKVVRVVGELDLSSAPALDTCLRQLLDDGSVRLLLDLSELSFCDSTGLRHFLLAGKCCDAAGGWLRLAGPHPQVLRVLQMTGLLAVLPTYADVAAAEAGGDQDRLDKA